MNKTINLNADLGESFGAWSMGDDESLLDIVASAKAYIDALNRLDHKERDALRTQEATGEPAINTCN